MTAVSISAVMVSWRTGPALLDAIEAVLADTAITELILIDHENPADLRRQVETLAAGNSRLKIVRTDENLGFGRGCNLGAAKASGDQLLFLNPDTRIEAGTASRLADVLSGQPVTALAGARILGSGGAEQSGSRRRELTLWRALATFTGLSRLGLAQSFGMESEPVPAEPQEVAAVSGAAFMMSRQGFETLGGFDETYFLHVEDIDLCRRAGPVFFVPDAIVHHIGGTSEASPLAVEWHKAKSFFRYFWKFGSLPGRLALLLAAPLMFAAILLRGLWRQITR
ncbi:glycosyltransferase family 2 protein [Hyphobacterium sp. HN65]|uniref:Glycosyltransferase family 2 protein n=1 Tax=Hyphobacterium lacteum TaxID=3116575 RepID=A0ABU7LPZ5_9PROT|nr:glycosyltransferase family 2 protein [Hyphobacterium sp. HN65]MEE2525986.1 glycosyltransferase family 2 protein [Hyphobacterium sp. HN65]